MNLFLPGILLPGYQLTPAYELEKSHAEAACGLSRGGTTASSGALQHNSSEFEAEEQRPGDMHADAQSLELV